MEQEPELTLLVGEQDTAGMELVCKTAQEMDVYQYVADQKRNCPMKRLRTNGCDRPDSGIFRGTQESDKKAETSEQTRTEESGDAMKKILFRKTGHQKVAAPLPIGMACAVCLVLVRNEVSDPDVLTYIFHVIARHAITVLSIFQKR